MEEPNIIIEETNVILENNPEPKNDKKLSTPQAIIIAAILIVVAILITQYKPGTTDTKNKSISEQVGVKKAEFNECVQKIATDAEAIYTQKMKSADDAMSALPKDQRGTPYSIIIGQNGSKTEVLGNQDYATVKKLIDEVIAGKVKSAYKGNVALLEPTDHVKGYSGAPITIIEYSDFECPYCKKFQPTMEKIMTEYNGQVKWVYRMFPLHQNSLAKLMAADCVGKIKGDDTYFKYADLMFGLLKTADEAPTDQL